MAATHGHGWLWRRDPYAAPAGLDIAGAAVAVAVAALVASALPVDHPYGRTAVMAAAVLVASAGTGNLGAAAAATALAALTTNGFLINRLGELSWHGMPDVYRTAILAAAAAVGFAVAALARADRTGTVPGDAAGAGRGDPPPVLRRRARPDGVPGPVRRGAGSRG